ncbi:metal-dependent hydrolase [Agitococcus lubricus]|uniref:Metal-dependent hydrolase n=1 Tax=Agitococcus lubricus TaxID=1077255 RepID=A0A2T5J1R9_9GAMM|nr:metal-dependent hydrolase [Agitococcus lubricus]PTQ90392.1 hypothetical protein C8N29_103145 [Agitococcus lubricus]
MPTLTPAHITIKPRHLQFAFNQDIPRYWFANDPVLTHFLNVLSITFPEGERFFLDSVRAFRDKVDDPQRQKDISGFIGQEALHSREHAAYNQFLATQGYEKLVQRTERVSSKLLKGGRLRLTPREQLAITSALEHITAVLAKTLLEHPQQLAMIHPSIRSLWLWHAIEETEHKAVAFDLYKEISHQKMTEKNTVMVLGTLYLLAFSGYFTWQFLRQDGVLRKQPWRVVRGYWRLLGYKGLLQPAIKEYFNYFKADFHPWQDDNSRYLSRAYAQLAVAA